MSVQENDLGLMDFLVILWKRKALVLTLTLICMVVATVIAFLLPRKWEVSAAMIPSKFLTQMEGGKFEEIVFLDPKQIVGQVNQGSYNNLIATELSLELRQFPEIRAENLKETNLVRIAIKERDIEKAKKVLSSLLSLIKVEADKKAEIEIKNTEFLIKAKEIETGRHEEEIKILRNKLAVVQQRKKEIENEMASTRKRIEALEADQRASLKKENRTEAESLGMLLYSNEIQQSLRYHDTLNELLNSKKLEEGDINIKIEENLQFAKQKGNEITNLTEKKGRIEYAQVKKEPTATLSPVSPSKKLIVGAAFIIGFLASCFLAFFLEYLEKRRSSEIA